MIEKAGAGMVMLIGVQSNQFPHALIWRRCASADSGGDRRIPCLRHHRDARRDDADLNKAKEMGISLFAGEAEGRLEKVLRDASDEQAQAAVQFHGGPAGHRGRAVAAHARRSRGAYGRQDHELRRRPRMPVQCSFCTIINVQGRKSAGVRPTTSSRSSGKTWPRDCISFFITDDNFARNKDWEAILDRLIHLREVEGLKMSVHDPGGHALPQAPELYREMRRGRSEARLHRTGEHQSRTAWRRAQKRQNKITEYRKMLQAWKAAKIITYCGYILGFPNDTPESIIRDVRS